MTFHTPALLYALPLALLPVSIHLIHLYLWFQVNWTAMFLQARVQKNGGRL
jgi:hypothetical protein